MTDHPIRQYPDERREKAETDMLAVMPDVGMRRVTNLYERWLAAGPPPLGALMSRWWDARLVELHEAIQPATGQPARATANIPAISGDTTRGLHCLRTQLAAERDKARRGDEHPRPDLDHLRVIAHNGIAAGLEIALGYIDQQLREAGE